jgi:hypothetical protein
VDRQRRLAELEEIIGEILAGIQETLQSGQRLENDFQDALADMIDAATDEIDILRAQIGEEDQQQSQNRPIEAAPAPSAQLMWILAGQKEDIFLEYLQTYPDPELRQLLNNPSALEQTIAQLHEMMPSGRPPVSEEGIPHAEVNSSNVYGYDYDPNSKKLKVKFQGNGGSGQGPVYEYNNVPANIYKSFENMSRQATTDGQNQWGKWWVGKPSLGASFYQLIRNGGYDYRKLS